ncbi:MAG: uroporphyrinogen decarboxylase [Deltaproteobacteria bacterium]|nr:uroporphyrinogen decarboxylase [Deltaproteobacteria bacterium]
MNSLERLMAACDSKPVDRPPVWLMRQAGRYLPEYRKLRKLHEFWEMMRNPELAAEVTMQPLRRFGVDAAILFSDILIVLDAMGVEVRYKKGGPIIHPLINDESGLTRLETVDADKQFAYLAETIGRLAEQLHPQVGLIGFAGAPFTLASYLIQKGPSKNLTALKKLAAKRPEIYEEILERICDVVVDLLRLQARAGADLLQIFDTWSGKLNLEEYLQLAQPYSERVIERLADLKIPVTLYIRNASQLAKAAASTGCRVLSIDCSLPIGEARARLGDYLALQGNYDPARLKGDPAVIRQEVQAMIESVRGTGLIVNLGQGLTPDTPVAGVEAFVSAVKEWSQ